MCLQFRMMRDVSDQVRGKKHYRCVLPAVGETSWMRHVPSCVRTRIVNDDDDDDDDEDDILACGCVEAPKHCLLRER